MAFMALRVTEEFVKHHNLLASLCGNSPSNVDAALSRNEQLAASIRQLDEMWHIVEQHRRFSKRRFIIQAHPKFRRALDDYEKRWKNKAMVAMWDWEAVKRGEEPLSHQFERFLKESEASSKANADESFDEDDDEDVWEFDPDKHSAASLIEFAEEIVHYEIDSGAEDDYAARCSRTAGALKWVRESIGLNIAEIERRWKEFPIITVPIHVSNRHGIEDPYSLFAYLTQIRLAYMIGADLAAIAMCRAATEILIRVHYNQDDKTDLMNLIKKTQERRQVSQLFRNHNIVSKVREANDILHFNKDAIQHRDRSRALIRDWVNALQDMILSVSTLRNDS
jgi:hypothetical protein